MWKIIVLFFLITTGIWLLWWDFIDYVTQGLNEGIWDFTIVQNGFPSIFVGFICVMVGIFLGVNIFKGR